MREYIGSEIYMAPGVLLGSYDYTIDIWGIGIITHILLCGSVPFKGETNRVLVNSILNDQPSFGGIKSSLTPEAIQFTMKCLNKKADQRPSAKQLLMHPWI